MRRVDETLTRAMYALRDVEANEQLYYSYLDDATAAMGTAERRAVLKLRYKFHCTCERCGWQAESSLSPAGEERTADQARA